MTAFIKPSGVKGEIQAPASKSSMQRACAAALISKGQTVIRNPGHSNDDRAALGLIRAMGAKISDGKDGVLVVSPPADGFGAGARAEAGMLTVNCGESGLGIRMFAPILALARHPILVTGEGSLMTRPMDFFDHVLPELGVSVSSNGGRLPLKVLGPLQPRNITIDGSLSSQFLTGLLMAYAAAGAKGVKIEVIDLKSKPYIDLTLDVMKRFGWEVENQDYKTFYFPGDKSKTERPVEYSVEGDWSGSAFLLVAGAIAGPLVVRGLDPVSTQADKAILQALEDCGASLSVEKDRIQTGPGPLRSFSFDATDCPDLFPPLVALASYCEGETEIKGVSRLSHKESDRGIALLQEFGKMGIDIRLAGDQMYINRREGIKAAEVDSHNDHRIAMACAVAGLRSTGPTIIHRAMAIDKSYPDFYTDLQKSGVGIEMREGQQKDAITHQTI